MKIMFNCLTTKKGGAERVISILANNFAKENDVSLMSVMNTEDDYFYDKKIKRYSLDKKNYFDSKSIIRKIIKLSPRRLTLMPHIIKKENPDIIISFLPEPSFRLMLVRKFSRKIKKIPVIISIRNDPNIEYKNPLIKWIMKKLYKNVDGMVFQTNDAKRYFDNIINLKNAEIIPNPIDEKFFVTPKNESKKQNKVITVGRLENQKNQLLLIEAFSKIVNKNPKYILEIYGEGNLKSTLQAKINDLGMTNKIFLKGQIDNVVDVLDDSKIFVLSSNYEGMPNALMEAMAIGLPCISTDCPCGGPSELISNGENGILVPVRDECKMTAAINVLINNDEKRRKIGKSAINIRQKYNIETISKQWNLFIKKVVKNNDKQDFKNFTR